MIPDSIILRYSFLFMLVSAPYATDQYSILDSLSETLHNPSGVMMVFEIQQLQFGEEWTESATLEILKKDQYLVETSGQIIKVDGNTIYSYYPATKQVVIDLLLENEFSLFNLLTGNFDQVTIHDMVSLSGREIVHFSISDMNFTGTIWINSYSFQPDSLILDLGEKNQIRIWVKSFDTLSSKRAFDEYNLDGWELIDLRE